MGARMKHTIVIESDEEGDYRGWLATSPTIPGLVCSATTLAELGRKLDLVIPALLNANGLPPVRGER